MSDSEYNRQLWLEKGYEHFALYGPRNLSINKLSKSVGLSEHPSTIISVILTSLLRTS